MPERSDLQKPVSPTNRPTAPEPQQPVETASQIPYVQDQYSSLPPVFGRYRILQLIGKGGMGAVYAAQDTKLERKVALKVPLIPQGNPVLRERFLREARAMAAFDHPHLCRVYDVDELNGVLYYTMPFIEGQPLSSWIRPEKPLSQKQAAMLVHKLALALQFAHDKGIIHRDLKPANIMIRKSADKGAHEPIIMDFGLARRDQADDFRLTRSGAPMGTIPYMSPEQLKGETKLIGPGCDIYSLGAVLYELLTGQMPLVRNSLVELQVAILKEEPPEPRTLRADLDPRLAAISLKCLRKERDERYRTMKELASALQEVVSKPAVRKATAKPASKTDTDIFADYPEVVAAQTAPPTARLAPTLRETDYAEASGKRGTHTWLALGGAAVAIVVIALVVLLIASNLGSGDGNATRPTYVTSSPRSTVGVRPTTPQLPPSADREPERLRPGLSTAQVQQIQKAWAQYLNRPVEEDLDLGGGVSMTVVLVPPGSFKMGTSEVQADEALRLDKDLKREYLAAEQPQHDVEISKPFYLGKHEVTQEQYQRITGSTPSSFSSTGDRKERVAGMDTRQFPVDTVSWEESTAFCDKLTSLAAVRRVGMPCRLPSEAEWEYACRAGTVSFFHFGDRLNGTEANCDGNFPFGTTAKGAYLERTSRVGSYSANALGLRDMHGNVWEWCQDWYDEKYYANSPPRDPSNEQKASARVPRGGSWVNFPWLCRAALRYGGTPVLRVDNIGFRVVVSVAPRTQ